MSPDPMDQMITDLRKASNQNMAFYREHLRGLVEAYRKNKDRYDRDALLNLMVKTLMQSDNTREALCYQVVAAVDILAGQ